VKLPETFKAGNISMFQLVNETGYCRMADKVSEALIRAALGKHPAYAQSWIEYCDDKRSSGTWYIAPPDDENRYEVGYFTESLRRQHQVCYDNLLDATASFIKRELDSICKQ